MPPIPVITPAQANQWDSASEAAGIPTRVLMETAGRAAASILLDRFGPACRQGVLIATGNGSNGGDGWVMARALHAMGIPCWVAPVGGDPTPLNAAVAALARAEGVREVAGDGPWPAAGVLVDALLGTGARGAPRGPVRGIMHRIEDLDLPIVAVDGPTGLDLGDGVCHESLRAAMTITFGGYRRGHLLSRDECGDLVLADIGLTARDPGWPTLATVDSLVHLMPPFPTNAHKGTRGRVVVVGGDTGMTGAARLAARAAFAAGAGLVHVVAPATSAAVLATAEPDLQLAPQEFGAPLTAQVQALLARADAVVIGPGLGRAPDRADLVLAALRASDAVVVDADGLMAFQGRIADLRDACLGRRVLLTPHLGEFRALFPAEAAVAAVDPWGAAADAAAAAGVTVLLKGVPTVVADGTGVTLTIAAGNPGLATGGSGDCLAGLAGAFLAQGLPPRDAAAMAAQALGGAADLAARRTGARALRPMDFLASLPDLWREWERKRIAAGQRRFPILHELPLPRRS
ncbi:MAG: NAD(P)H-hydrate dehydratase [Gemmatimonadota bacterium]|nr:NAD(P)H-hydrate dehydratase [Gemmatimonadota bacterium]